jgi:hypothetical protein
MEEYADRRYVTFSVEEIDLIDFDKVFQTSSETLRLSTDKSLTFVKYNLPTPTCITNLTTKSEEYEYTEFSALLKTSDWIGNASDIPST